MMLRICDETRSYNCYTGNKLSVFVVLNLSFEYFLNKILSEKIKRMVFRLKFNKTTLVILKCITDSHLEREKD